MFNSQYYTCEQVDERLLQGYVDDFNEVNNTNYSKEDLLLKIFQAINLDQVFGKYEENPEFVRLYLDANQRILWGIKVNGDIYYGVGVPSQIIDYIDSKLREKVDKEEGKSLIDANFASGVTYIENPEFIEAKLDANNKILSFIHKDGSHYVRNLHSETLDEIDNEVKKLKDLFDIIDDPEQRLQIGVDQSNKIFNYRKSDGTLVELSGIETPEINLSKHGLEKLSEELDVEIPEDVGTYKKPNLPKYGVTNIKTEKFYLTAHENVSSIEDVVCIQDFEDTSANAWQRITISHYYVKDSTLIENADGTFSPTENSTKLLHYAAAKVKYDSDLGKYFAKDTILKKNGRCWYVDTLVGAGRKNQILEGYSVEAPFDQDLPEGSYKMVNTEVVEITGPVRVDAWVVPDWDYNAIDGTDIGKKYGHYCIADVDFGYYLSKENAAIEVKHQGNSTQGYRKRNFRYTFYKNNNFAKKDKIKIGEMLRLSKFNLKASWNDNSRIKELILYRIFSAIWQNRPIIDRYNWDNSTNGLYHGISGNIHGFPIRLDIGGEFYGVYTFCLPKDGKNYDIDDEDEDTGLLVSGAHNTYNDWGITLPYAIADHYDSEMDSEDFSDYPKIVAAITEWTHFINGRLYNGSDGNTYNSTELTNIDETMYVTSTLEDGQVTPNSVSATLIKFNKKNIPSRLDVLGFMDYIICMQTFVCYDNQHNNMLIYSGPEKKKMFPFFYDVDAAIVESRPGGYECDIFADGVSLSNDLSLWKNLRDLYWDEIVNRYCILRKSYLSIDYIKTVYQDIAKNIPHEDYINESNKWGSSIDSSNFEAKLSFLEKRLKWLDEEYFIV